MVNNVVWNKLNQQLIWKRCKHILLVSLILTPKLCTFNTVSQFHQQLECILCLNWDLPRYVRSSDMVVIWIHHGSATVNCCALFNLYSGRARYTVAVCWPSAGKMFTTCEMWKSEPALRQASSSCCGCSCQFHLHEPATLPDGWAQHYRTAAFTLSQFFDMYIIHITNECWWQWKVLKAYTYCGIIYDRWEPDDSTVVIFSHFRCPPVNKRSEVLFTVWSEKNKKSIQLVDSE